MYVCERDRMCMWLCWNKCMFVYEKRLQKICGDTRGLLIGSSTSRTEENSIHIPEAHNGACRGSNGVAQKCQSRYTVHLGRALHGRWPAQYRQTQRCLDLMDVIVTSSLNQFQVTSEPCLFLCLVHHIRPHRPSLQFARRLNVKIKVNGIRVNKTTGCLGNGVPCPTHSSLAFTFVQSLKNNNILLTEDQNRQQCSIFVLYLNKRGLPLEHTQDMWKTEKHTEKQKRTEIGRGRGFRNTLHLHYHNHQSAIHPKPAPLN